MYIECSKISYVCLPPRRVLQVASIQVDVLYARSFGYCYIDNRLRARDVICGLKFGLNLINQYLIFI